MGGEGSSVPLPVRPSGATESEKLDGGTVATVLLVLAPGYHYDVHGRDVAYVSEVGLVAVVVGGRAVVGLMQAAVVGAATAAGVGIVVEPGGQLAAASAEHTRAARGQTVSVVGEHRKP
jgi:hypothetical protein